MFDFYTDSEIAIFVKNKDDGSNDQDYVVMALERLTDNDVVGCSQTKTRSSQKFAFFEPLEADNEWMRASNFFIDNDWDLVYYGNRNRG